MEHCGRFVSFMINSMNQIDLLQCLTVKKFSLEKYTFRRQKEELKSMSSRNEQIKKEDLIYQDSSRDNNL